MNGLIQSKKQIEKQKTLAENQKKQDEKFMRAALKQARVSLAAGEIPVGAVIVKNGEIIARGSNKKEKKNCAVYHAEINAIISASKKLGWRLDECEIYVTLEPCAMCAGAIVSSRIKRVVFGASQPNSGACGTKADINVLENGGLNFKTQSTGGVLENECLGVLREFFYERRKEDSCKNR